MLTRGHKAFLLACSIIVFALMVPALAEEATPVFSKEINYDRMTSAEKTAARNEARQHKYEMLKFCADPGNMPLSNMAAEGLQNRIAAAVAARMGARLSYFWRPYLERGLTRETFDNRECDILIELPSDYPNILTSEPIYRSTYVFVTREDSGIVIDGFDDADLRTRKIGVFQQSAAREALARHGIKQGLDLHVISHDADLRPEHQPWQQVQKVADGKLDIALVWGPFAGWVKQKGAPIALTPANRMEDQVVLEFSLSFGVRRDDVVLKYALDFALQDARAEIRAILDEFGVPLVRCSACIVDGELPSHGTYFKTVTDQGQKRFTEIAPKAARTIDRDHASPDQIVTVAAVEAALAAGADVNDEFSNAVLASDDARMALLLERGADINKRDNQGATALITAAKSRDTDVMEFLLGHGAKIEATDLSGWSALHHAILRNHVPSITMLAAQGADLAKAAPGDISPLGLAIGEGKYWAAKTLIEAGAPIDQRFGAECLTALMVAATQHEASSRNAQIVQGPSVVEIAEALVAKQADVNARSRDGVTALMIAAGYDNAAMIGLLAKAGADFSLIESNGRSAYDVAVVARADAAIRAIKFFGKKP